jgi:hypothetical protein
MHLKHFSFLKILLDKRGTSVVFIVVERPNLVGVFCFWGDPPGFAAFSVALCAPASVLSVLNLCLFR